MRSSLRWSLFCFVTVCCRAEESEQCAATTLYAFIAKSLPLSPIWDLYFSGEMPTSLERHSNENERTKAKVSSVLRL